MLRYLLDTNIVIYVLKRRPVEVLSTFNAYASRMAISSITLVSSNFAKFLLLWFGFLQLLRLKNPFSWLPIK